MLRLRVFFPLIIALLSDPLFSQIITEDFADGNFNAGTHIWTGDAADWAVVGQRLNVNASASGTYYLSTPFAVAALDSAVWEFDVEFTVATGTTNNYAEIFLVSDLPDVEGNVDGYFVRLNNTLQEISLWRSSNGSNSKIIDGTDGVTASNLAFRVRVTRSAAGEWALFHDNTVTGNNYVSEGTTTDVNFTGTAFFGIVDRHSAASRNQWLFVDNINVQHFLPMDITPATITGVNVTSNTQLEVQFDEFIDVATATTLANYTANGQTAASATIAAADSARVSVDFATAFQNCVTETLIVANVQDRSGNVMLSDTSSYISCVTLPAGFRDVVFTEVFADPTPVVCSHPNAEFVEIYNRGIDPVNLNGWTFQDATSSRVITTANFILQPGDYAVLSDSVWGANTLQMNLPSLTNSGEAIGLRDSTGQLIDTLTYDVGMYTEDSTQGYGLEIINPDVPCLGAANIASSTDPCQATPGAVNSINDPTFGTTAPAISGVSVTGTTTLEVCFAGPVDSASATVAGTFSVAGLGTATAAVPVAPDFECINLTFPNPINTGTQYTLLVNGLQDCVGNTLVDSISFLESGPAAFKSVIINEIYFEVDNINPLPEAEYVELYNRSNSLFDLAGWTFADRSSDVVLGSYILQPGAYVVLCHEDSLFKFAGLPALGLSSFPILNNADDDLGLRDPLFGLVDSVMYTDEDYQNPDRDDGGWALELINPEDTCTQLGNWIVSNDPAGGTPGAQNSVYDATPDTGPPTISGVTILSSTAVQICFDETLGASASNPANYTINNGQGNPTNVVIGGTGDACVLLVLGSPISVGTIYTVDLDIADCKGNSGAVSTTFVQGGAAAPFQIVINEIYFEPGEGTGLPEEEEYIELYNAGPGAVDLTGWTISDRTGTSSAFSAATILADSFLLIGATGDVALLATYGTTLGVGSFPSLNNSDDDLQLRDSSGALIDFVNYLDDWYGDDSKASGGYSLERVDPGFNCLNAGNWRASEDASGGTPGRVNSIRGTFTDTEAPTLVTAYAIGPDLVRVEFSEIMDGVSIEEESFYQIDNNIGVPVGVITAGDNVSAVDLLLFNSLQPETVYCLTVDGVEDCAGNPTVQQEVCFGLADSIQPGDIILNEILFDPYSGGSRFLEFYNNSNKILDLSTLNIARRDLETNFLYSIDPVSTEPLVMLPGTYLAVTEDKANVEATYLPVDPNAIVEIDDLPAFDNSEDICVIYVDSFAPVDELYYLDDWHFPNLDTDDGVSLERQDFNRPTQDEFNWHSAASTVNFATPGYENSQVLVPEGVDEVWLQPETFSPNQDGRDDEVSINYRFNSSGWNVKASVLDNKGRMVRTIKQNFLVGTTDATGTITWDGTTETGNKANIGIYVILIEASNPNTGETKNFKLGCVLAENL
ncbi:MAG: lamin tail domain-containing protein [Bacteroidota bacterium]